MSFSLMQWDTNSERWKQKPFLVHHIENCQHEEECKFLNQHEITEETGIRQESLSNSKDDNNIPKLYYVGCLGNITSFR